LISFVWKNKLSKRQTQSHSSHSQTNWSFLKLSTLIQKKRKSKELLTKISVIHSFIHSLSQFFKCSIEEDECSPNISIQPLCVCVCVCLVFWRVWRSMKLIFTRQILCFLLSSFFMGMGSSVVGNYIYLFLIYHLNATTTLFGLRTVSWIFIFSLSLQPNCNCNTIIWTHTHTHTHSQTFPYHLELNSWKY
jgi:hypothetical protein